MKYKVSLLPEKNRKRLNSKKKAEKVKVIALIALCIVFSLVVVAVTMNFYADSVLQKEKAKNQKYDQIIADLSEYRAINQSLQQKVALIDSIQVDEPSLCNFIASVSNIEQADISIEAIDCADWKSSRSCTISGTCYTREAYILYTDALRDIDGVSGLVESQFVAGRVDGETVYQFVVFVSCSGGKTASAATTVTE